MIEDDEAFEADAPDAYEDMRDAGDWLECIRDAEKYWQFYHDKCDNIDKQFGDLKSLSDTAGSREFQIFWANMEVLKPSIYSRPPVPVVATRFKDRKELPRHASEIIERTLITAMDTADLHATMLELRDDLATAGRGAAWVRYENDGESERVVPEHVDRKDFLHEPARKWREVSWVARRVWLSKKQMRERFEQTSGDAWLHATYTDHKADDDKGDEYKGEEKAAVWELWHKHKRVVVWVTPGIDDVLDIGPPHLNLEGFFPCPQPVYGTVQRGTLIPIPDYVYYKDQVEEINVLTNRISALTEALKIRGFYAAGNPEVGDAIEAALKSGSDNATLVPISVAAAFGGGPNALVIWLPIDMVSATIAQLVELRKQIIQDVYEITGISDIMRGSTDAGETLGAQQLKSQYGSVRVRDKQEGLIRIARDIIRISGEVIAENFDPQTIMAMSQYDRLPMVPPPPMPPQQMPGQAQGMPPQGQPLPQQAPGQQPEGMAAQQPGEAPKPQLSMQEVFAFLRDQRMRPFVLEIETDSTILPDENAAKQRVTEFLGAMAPTLAQLAPMVQAQPQSAPFAGEILKFALTPFRAGREMEAAVDEFVEQMNNSAKQAGQRPDPEQMKAEQEGKAKEAELQMKGKELELKAQEAAAKIQLERDRMVADTRNQQMQQFGEQGGDVSALIQAELQHMGAQMAELKAGREQVGQMMQMLLQALTAPKEIVYDPSGKPLGVKPVMPNNGTLQ